MAEKALRYFKSFFKKKDKEENDIEK